MHFTYAEEKAFSSKCLCQGDIIARTDGVNNLLEKIHPYYFENSEKYPFFIVLTQTCDLVRRNDGKCNSKYITIAAVRPLETAIERQITQYQYEECEKELKFCNENKKIKIRQFLERLFNNNEPNYFFLRQETSKGLFSDYCAFLHLSVALKSNLNYDTLLKAKIIQLEESFQHKLGYLTGQIYSRIGTQDWDKPSLKSLIDNCFKDHVDEARIWLKDSIHKKAVEKLKECASWNREDFDTIVNDVSFSEKLETKKGKVIEIISNILKEAKVDSASIDKIRRKLSNNSEFSSRIK